VQPSDGESESGRSSGFVSAAGSAGSAAADSPPSPPAFSSDFGNRETDRRRRRCRRAVPCSCPCPSGAAAAAAAAAASAAAAQCGHFLFRARTSAPTAQADLAVRSVDTQNLDLDLVADLDDILGTLGPCVGQLRDVQQPFQASFESTNTPKLVSLVTLPVLISPGL